MRVSVHGVGPLYVNCYVVQDEGTGRAAIIDPGGVSEELLEQIDRIGTDKIDYILLTHFHFDHILGAARLHIKTGAPVAIHRLEEKGLDDPALNGLDGFGFSSSATIKADMTYDEGDTFVVGDLTLRVMHTPGHTVGSSCFVCENAIFSGDTLFCESVGRTDLPTGNQRDILRSVNRLCQMDGDYDVYPGHDCKTTLSHERAHNPYYGVI